MYLWICVCILLAGRESTLWVRVWHQCSGMCGDVHAVEPDEQLQHILWMCGECAGILSPANGGTLCLCCSLFPSVSIHNFIETFTISLSVLQIKKFDHNICPYIHKYKGSLLASVVHSHQKDNYNHQYISIYTNALWYHQNESSQS